MRTWLGIVLAIAACKGNAAKKQPVPAAPPVVAPAGSATGSGSAAHARKQASQDQLAAYKRHMKAGWALQKQQKWAESVPELEAAVAAIDGDQRALAELGWSAMNAGDYKKARRADDLAVRVALDPNVKASALFNLGTVEAKTGNVDDARVSFAESLKLRPNKTVEAELAKLGAAPAVEKPFCEAGKDPCACVYEDAANDATAADRGCDVKTDPALPATWKIYTALTNGWELSYVLDEHNNYLFQSASSDDHVRHVGDMAIDKVETKTVGTHKVLWIEQHDHSMETILRGDDNEQEIVENRSAVTLCVLGDATTPTRCPLRAVPVDRIYEGEGSDKSETVAAVTLTDGTATVKLTSGPSCCGLDAVIGPHKLW